MRAFAWRHSRALPIKANSYHSCRGSGGIYAVLAQTQTKEMSLLPSARQKEIRNGYREKQEQEFYLNPVWTPFSDRLAEVLDRIAFDNSWLIERKAKEIMERIYAPGVEDPINVQGLFSYVGALTDWTAHETFLLPPRSIFSFMQAGNNKLRLWDTTAANLEHLPRKLEDTYVTRETTLTFHSDDLQDGLHFILRIEQAPHSKWNITYQKYVICQALAAPKQTNGFSTSVNLETAYFLLKAFYALNGECLDVALGYVEDKGEPFDRNLAFAPTDQVVAHAAGESESNELSQPVLAAQAQERLAKRYQHTIFAQVWSPGGTQGVGRKRKASTHSYL